MLPLREGRCQILRSFARSVLGAQSPKFDCLRPFAAAAPTALVCHTRGQSLTASVIECWVDQQVKLCRRGQLSWPVCAYLFTALIGCVLKLNFEVFLRAVEAEADPQRSGAVSERVSCLRSSCDGAKISVCCQSMNAEGFKQRRCDARSFVGMHASAGAKASACVGVSKCQVWDDDVCRSDFILHAGCMLCYQQPRLQIPDIIPTIHFFVCEETRTRSKNKTAYRCCMDLLH